MAAVRRRRVLLAAVAVAALGVAAALVLLSGGPEGGVASGSSTTAGATGTVERRTLAERLTATGTIGFAGDTTVLARLSGTVTALPAVGDVVRRGRPLYGVGGEPVILMYGAVPAYRTLAEGISDGTDVEELELNLAALGYDPGTVDDEFTYLTADAVEAWQEDLGLEITGEVELGRVAFLRGPQRVMKLEATLGEALGGGGTGGGGGSGSNLVAWHPEEEEGTEEAQELAELERELEKEKREREREREKRAREKEREKEKKERERQKAKVAKPQPQPIAEPRPEPESEPQPEPEPEPEAGEPEPGSVPIMRTSSTRRVVSVDLEANQQSIAHRGQPVQVVLPGGTEVPGKVTGLTAVEASAGGGPEEGESEAGVEASISVEGKHKVPALDGVSVSVRFTQRVRKHVLSVPLTALIAIGGERFAVEVTGAGGRRRILVTPGLAADGYVEVQGSGLRAGMKVETGE